MSFVNKLYQNVFRRTSTFALTIFVGAIFFERAFDQGSDYIWNRINQGKLWHHIKDKLPEKPEDDDE